MICGDKTGVDLSKVDHLVYGSPDLDLAIDRIEELLGVRASAGGSHEGLGTRNALVSLGPNCYLEIIAPDPAQADYLSPRPFGIDDLESPRLITWAARGTNLASLVQEAARHGLQLGDAIPMSRQLPGGQLLTWTLTYPQSSASAGVTPFFIDWGDTPHPSLSAATGAQLRGLTIEHPRPEEPERDFQCLGIDVRPLKGPDIALSARIEGRLGLVELHS